MQTKFDLQRLLYPTFDQDGYASCSTFVEYWRKCPRGSWMLCVATETGVGRRVLARTTAQCVIHAAEHLLPQSSLTPLQAVSLYGDGKIEAGLLLPFVEVASKTEFRLRYVGNKAEHFAAAAVLSAITFCKNGGESKCAEAAIQAIAAYAASRVRETLMTGNVDVEHAAELYAQHIAQKERQLADVCRKKLTKAVLAQIGKLEKEFED